MSTTLAATALLMGLAGGPHCVAMCGAACAGVVRMGSASRPALAVAAFTRVACTGYSMAGAAAAQAVQSFAWLAAQTAALRPVWTLFHLAVLAWGLMLLVLGPPARMGQPGGAHGLVAAAAVGRRARRCLHCGSTVGLHALRAAVLGAARRVAERRAAGRRAVHGPVRGGQRDLAQRWRRKLLARLQDAGNRLRKDFGTRASGFLLVMAAALALWTDLAHRVAVWCGLA